MASLDGKRSFLASSDEVIQHACGPCEGDGETKEAHYLCEFCKLYLCFDCRNEHRSFKVTKSHSVVSVQVTKRTTSAAMKGTFAILCGCDQKRAVGVYCEKHKDVICSTCETIKHRSCNTFPIKDKITRNTKKEFKELMDKGKSLKTGIESCRKEGEVNQKKAEGCKEEHKKKIREYRRELDKLLDKMENESLEDVDTNMNPQLLTIKKCIATLTTSQQELNADLDILDKANKTNDEEIMFSANVKLSKSMSAYDEVIQDIKRGIQQPKLKFHKHEKLLDVLQSMKGIGSIESSAVGSDKKDHVVILDMKVKSTKEVNIRLPDDDYDPSIVGCAFLSNSRILLCDYDNRKVKLLESGMSVKKSLKLSNKPYNVAAVGECEAVVTFGYTSNDLQYIYTHPDLKLGKKITLPVKCYGLHVVNDEIYTTYHKESGHDEIWRLDRVGNIMSKIVLTQSSSGRSDYLGLCLAGSSPRVYLTDHNDSKVTCFQLDGKMVYQYQDQELKRPNGIYVDSAGNCLVCGANSNNVFVVTADGRKHRELLTSKDITWPRCIDYRPEDNTLIVGCEHGEYNSNFFVCKLGM